MTQPVEYSRTNMKTMLVYIRCGQNLTITIKPRCLPMLGKEFGQHLKINSERVWNHSKTYPEKST